MTNFELGQFHRLDINFRNNRTQGLIELLKRRSAQNKMKLYDIRGNSFISRKKSIQFFREGKISQIAKNKGNTQHRVEYWRGKNTGHQRFYALERQLVNRLRTISNKPKCLII